MAQIKTALKSQVLLAGAATPRDTLVLFSWVKFGVLATVAFSFLFGN